MLFPSAAMADEVTDAVNTDQITAVEATAADIAEASDEQYYELVENGKLYLVTADGTHCTGWFEFSKSAKRYFDPKKDGAAASGMYKIDGNTYLFNSNYYLINNEGINTYNDAKYWVRSNGALASGWLTTGGKKYYFNPDDYKMVTGIYNIGRRAYMFGTDGAKLEYSGVKGIGDDTYAFASDGALKSGWVSSGSDKLYFSPTDYKAYKNGIFTIGSKKYMFNSWGALCTGAGLTWIGSDLYYIGSDGALSGGWKTVNGNKYYFDPTTYKAALAPRTIDGESYYFDSDGVNMTWPEYRVMKDCETIVASVGEDLSACFTWCVNNITYSTAYDSIDEGSGGYSLQQLLAVYAFEAKAGDCRGFAAAFEMLAKYLGYEVHYVAGYVPLASGGTVDHAWTEVVINGTTYVCDPEFQNETGYNGYMITYGASQTWQYSNYARVD